MVTIKLKIVEKKDGIYIELQDQYNSASQTEIAYADILGRSAYEALRKLEEMGAEVLDDKYHGLREEDQKGGEEDVA
jgi:hypothetical protein